MKNKKKHISSILQKVAYKKHILLAIQILNADNLLIN